MNRNNIKLGAFYMLISVTGFSIMDIAVKWTTADYSIGNTSDRESLNLFKVYQI